MKMVNMKQEPEKAQPEVSSMKMDQPRYPYGLRVCLCEADLKKLGIKELPAVGSKMKLQAEVEVVSVSMSESQMYGENRSMDLQITDMGLSGSSESKE